MENYPEKIENLFNNISDNKGKLDKFIMFLAMVNFILLFYNGTMIAISVD